MTLTLAQLQRLQTLADEFVVNRPIPMAPTAQGEALVELVRAVPDILLMAQRAQTEVVAEALRRVRMANNAQALANGAATELANVVSLAHKAADMSEAGCAGQAIEVGEHVAQGIQLITAEALVAIALALTATGGEQ